MREHRLYQADWLMRFYGFEADEIVAGGRDGLLDLGIDPKLAWALSNRALFPVDVNRADREMLLRVPGLGVRAVDRIIAARRHHRLRLEDVARAGGLDRQGAAVHRGGGLVAGRADRRCGSCGREADAATPEQLSLF